MSGDGGMAIGRRREGGLSVTVRYLGDDKREWL